MEFGVYYSHNIDWKDGADAQAAMTAKLHPELSEHQKTFGANTWDPSPNSFEDYLNSKAFPQVKELMTQYPDMKLLWYDMHTHLCHMWYTRGAFSFIIGVGMLRVVS